jgi:transposase
VRFQNCNSERANTGDPIIKALWAHILSAERIHADDTKVPVLAKMKNVTGGSGPMCATIDRSVAGIRRRQSSVIRVIRERVPQEHLASYVGIMQADAFAGINPLYDAKRRPAPIIEAACWSHGRRYFFKLAQETNAPIAVEAVRRIDELFETERAINGMTPDQRIAVRQAKSKPLIRSTPIIPTSFPGRLGAMFY